MEDLLFCAISPRIWRTHCSCDSGRKVFIRVFAHQSLLEGQITGVTAQSSPFCHALISASLLGRPTKYYLRYLLIHPPWCQMLMTRDTDLQSAWPPHTMLPFNNAVRVISWSHNYERCLADWPDSQPPSVIDISKWKRFKTACVNIWFWLTTSIKAYLQL